MSKNDIWKAREPSQQAAALTDCTCIPLQSLPMALQDARLQPLVFSWGVLFFNIYNFDFLEHVQFATVSCVHSECPCP